MTTLDDLNARGQGYLTSRLHVRPELLAPNGYLHTAAAIIALADTACGYVRHLYGPPQQGHELHSLPLSSKATSSAPPGKGTITCTATLLHSARTTQVRDAEVTDLPKGRFAKVSGKTIASFRCTQLILYPR